MLCVALMAGCVGPPRWKLETTPQGEEVEVLLTVDDAWQLERDLLPHEVPAVPMPRTLRPCCIFGDQVGVRLGPLPVPFFRMRNVRGLEDLGHHAYDSGIVRFRRSGRPEPGLDPEKNGLVYTCRGGFVDVAHLRDWADWTVYLASLIVASLHEGFSLDLPREGGRRLLEYRPPPRELIERMGSKRLAIALAQWAAFQLSIWHEIITWYGWNSVVGFHEEASAYSPEDLYSNLLGIRIAGGMLARRGDVESEGIYNHALDRWLHVVLEHLGSVPRRAGMQAIEAVDQIWWDSHVKLPDRRFVLRRHFDLGDQRPWLVPPRLVRGPDTAKLREACGSRPQPLEIRVPRSLENLRFVDWIGISIELDDRYARQAPFDELGPTITEADFPTIAAFNREQNREEFGPDAHRPD